MNKYLLNKLAQQEVARREKELIPNVLEHAFQEQLLFIQDPHKRKALCCSRRSGKSLTAALYLLDGAINNPKGKYIYIGLTNASARNVMWQDLIESLCIKYSIFAEFLESKQEIKFNNGATIYLVGVDATPKQMNRLRGNKYKLAIIDEAQSFTQDLRLLINSVLGMTLAETNSTLALLGTPGDQQSDQNYWFSINRLDSQEKDWKLFSWSWKDNPHVKDQIQIEVDNMIANNPLVINTASFKQEILGEWVISNSSRVYQSSHLNYIDQLPLSFLNSPTYILSIDLGYYDATAFVVAAYNNHFDSNLYVLESFKKSELTITDVANIIKELKKKYYFSYHVVDAANAQAVHELRKVHNLPLEAAEKQGKEAHIALLNSDFITENIKILKSPNQELIKELDLLIWDQRALSLGKHKESASKDNHLTDALLYSHHFSHHYWYKPPKPFLTPEEALLAEIQSQFGKKEASINHLKKPWWEVEDSNEHQ